jgi:hypothetical protein
LAIIARRPKSGVVKAVTRILNGGGAREREDGALPTVFEAAPPA